MNHKKLHLIVFVLALTLNPIIRSIHHFVPMVKASMIADNFVTELTSLPFNPYAVDVDSQGWIFVEDHLSNDVWRSKDQGATWTKVLDKPSPPSALHATWIFVDSNDYIHASMWKTGLYWEIYRSTDGGDSWSLTLSDAHKMWHATEDLNGYLYVNEYATDDPYYLWRSTDNGATWTAWVNTTLFDHMHTVGVDIANNDIYTAIGDAPTGNAIQKWDGVAWSNLTLERAVTEIWSDGQYVYFGDDGKKFHVRIPSGGTWEQNEIFVDTSYLGTGTGNMIFEAVRLSDGTMYFGTEEGKLMGSWDGERWVKLIDISSGSIFSISNRRPLYVVKRQHKTPDEGRLWRVDTQKEDLIRLFYRQYLSKRGSENNADSFVVEQRLWNDTNYVDLTHVALKDVQATIKGLSSVNILNNSGFETGTKTGWSELYTPYGTIKSGEAANGTYYYSRVGDVSQELLLYQKFVPSAVGDVHIITFYAKANITKSVGMFVLSRFQGVGATNYLSFDLTTTWQKFSAGLIHTDASYTGFSWYILFEDSAAPIEYSLDSVLHINLASGVGIEGASETDGIQYIHFFKYAPYFHGTTNTTNPSLIIAGQTVSHPGTLTNGTQSSTTSLSGILTGAVKVEANIQGSGQAILKINGTRLVYEDSIILQGRTDNVYYGRYYGTIIPTPTSDLIAVTNLASNITSLSYDGNKLTLTIDSPSATSTTKVYCGDKGEPTEVYATNGTPTWSYNASTMMLALNVMHNGPANILVDWRIPGDVNGDGKVDNSDLSNISKAYGSHPSKLNWNPDCDFNWDSKVDASDLFDLSKNYGKTLP